MTEPNPVQIVLRRQIGVDAFAIDGDDTELAESWLDRPRRRQVVVQQ